MLSKFYFFLFLVLSVFTVNAFAIPAVVMAENDTQNELEDLLKKPDLKIHIPGLDFTDPDDLSTVQDERGNQYILIPYLGEYLAAVYRYAVVAVSVLSVVILIFAGIQWMIPAGEGGSKDSAKKRIAGAMTGLVITIGSYTLLYTINPNLVEFKNLKVLYVNRKDLDEFESVSFEFENYALSAHGKIIEQLIGPNTLPPCPKEAAQAAAAALHNKQICVGPCHCAYSASNFLNYIGCTDVYSGLANKLPEKLKEKGWVETPIDPSNLGNLPVGLLWKDGHVGVSIGNGMDFESGSGTRDFDRLNKETKNNCPSSFVEAMKDPQACAFCSKIPEESPASGHFGAPALGGTGGGGSCKSNQGWSKGKMSDRKGKSSWVNVVHPPISQ